MRNWSTEPADIVRDAAIQVLREAALPLRNRGWNAELIVTGSEDWDDHFFDVSLRIRVIQPGRIPDEARP